MKTKFVALGIAAGIFCTPLIALAADADMDNGHPVDFVKDSVITTKVKSKLAAEHLSSTTRIQVDTDKDGVVWLSGYARSREEADRAIAVASRTDGVRSVKDHLKIRSEN
ncbi:MAG: BON domain-containing protein [Burkholderiaceae bacterium]|jgi:hyperosmotically inducible protein